MKLTIERKELLTALGTVKSGACARPPLTGTPAILTHVLINTFDKSVEFICSDLNVVLRSRVDAGIHRKGATTVRVHLLHELARSFTDDQVKLELIKGALHVECGESQYKLGTLPVEEFPETPRLRDASEIEVPQATLRALLSSTAFAAGAEHEYVLSGSLLRINGNGGRPQGLTAVGCDATRLALLSAEAEPRPGAEGLGKKERNLILPRPTVRELLRLLPEDEEKNCRLVAAANLAQFHIGDTVLTTKLIDGDYPPYTRVIPKTEGRGIAIGRVSLLAALQRCALISDVCQLDFNKQTLNIRAVSNTEVGVASESLLVSSPKNLRVSFIARHLIEPLSVVDDDEVQFFGHPGSPGMIKVASKPWLSVILPRKEKAAEPAVHKDQTKPQPKPETKPEKETVAEVNGAGK